MQTVLCLKSGHPSGFGSLLIPHWQTSQVLLPAQLNQMDRGTFEQKGVIRTMWLCCAASSERPVACCRRRQLRGPWH